MAATTEPSEFETIPRAKSSLWQLTNALGSWKSVLYTQRRQSKKLIEDMVNGFDHCLDGDNNVVVSTLTWFERATHINRRYLFIGAILFAVSYLSMGRNAGTLCNVLGMTYPIYASIKATENMAGYTKEHWLMYWIVYSTISFLEVLLEIFLVWLPLYYLIKFLFLSWCMVPISVNGSNVIYCNIIRPLFHQHSDKVETALSAVTQKLTDMSNAETTGTPRSGDDGVRERRVTNALTDDNQ